MADHRDELGIGDRRSPEQSFEPPRRASQEKTAMKDVCHQDLREGVFRKVIA